jgi:hypothetical protein
VAEGFIEVAADSTGKKVRTEELTVGANTVEQQVISLATSTGTLLDDPSRSSVTQPISAASLPLPAGAAIEAGHLAAIDTSTARIPAQGQALAAASVPVVLTAAQQTALTPPAAITGFALEAGHLAAIDTATAAIKTDVDKIPAQGQALAAASMPVVLTAAQQTALTPPAAIAGFALEAGHLASLDTKAPALGQALAAASVPVILPAATVTTLTPPAAITGFALDSTVAKDGADITTPSPAMPAGGVGIRGWLSAIWTKLNGTIAVTGTFWQAVQPVSGTFWQATQPVSGTFFQATQPVSGTVAVSALPATPAGTNVIGHVIADTGSTTAVTSLPAITKGTQGTTGVSVQDLKDSGRTSILLFLDAVTGITTEALATMSINKGGVAQTAATSYTVTAGKTLRISGMHTSVKNTSTVASDSRTRLRQAASSFSVSSPIVLLNEAGSVAAIANAVGTDDTSIPDGLEIAGGQIIGISHIESATTCTVSVVITGYEY